MAEYLARRDGWAVPSWARLPGREAWPWWFVTDLRGLHPRALVESPSSFRRRSSMTCRRNWRHAGREPSSSSSEALPWPWHIDATRATRDLNAVFIPTDVVRQAAAAVAQHRGLTEDWLNDAVKGFLPGPDPDAQRSYSSDSLIVDVASPRYLLAMKLFAARADWPSSTPAEKSE